MAGNSFPTKAAAREFARQKCPKGWRYEVWNNLGWHVCWYRGPVAVYLSSLGSKSTYHALLMECHPDERGSRPSGGHCGWTTKGGSHRTIEAAARAEIKSFRRWTENRRRMWEAMEAECKEITDGGR